MLRSWALIMANTTYIQFVLTDVQDDRDRRLAVVTCAENILTAADADEPGFAAGRVVATNIYRPRPGGVAAVAPPRLAGPASTTTTMRRNGSLTRRRPLRVTGLRARGRHGCLPAERELGQEFVVDVALGLDTAPAAAADDLALTVDYGALARGSSTSWKASRSNLIETLAERLATACLAHELVEEAEVSVHKPAAPIPLPFGDVVGDDRRGRAMRVVISLGSNLGRPPRRIQGAVDELFDAPGLTFVGVAGLRDRPGRRRPSRAAT